MYKRNEIINAAKIIKEYCKNNNISSKCYKKCMFSDYPNRFCIFSDIPEDWEIPKKGRFTESEIYLAKMYKQLGGYTISRPKEDYIIVKTEKDEILGTLMGQFLCLDLDEEVYIDDIISEELW